MARKQLLLAASTLIAGAAVFFAIASWRLSMPRGRAGFVQTDSLRFVIDRKPFRFVGANVAVMYRDDDRAHMPETLRQAAQVGIKVVRVWASGEGGPRDVKPIADFNDWPRTHAFRYTPSEWNEAEFVFLDQVLAEAARDGLRVQLCLANWWRDTGGVTQYLRWAGISGADDDKYPFGINNEKAMQFYSNETARRLYREHVEKIVMRRNSINGVIYRDDPTIFGFELLNEAQCLTGRWAERRAWFAEMSAHLKSLDPDHPVSGASGLRIMRCRRLITAMCTTIRLTTPTSLSTRRQRSRSSSRIAWPRRRRSRSQSCLASLECPSMATKDFPSRIGMARISNTQRVMERPELCSGF